MSTDQLQGRVDRVLPDRRCVVRTVNGQDVTATSSGPAPRPGSTVLLANPGSGWVVISWQ